MRSLYGRRFANVFERHSALANRGNEVRHDPRPPAMVGREQSTQFPEVRIGRCFGNGGSFVFKTVEQLCLNAFEGAEPIAQRLERVSQFGIAGDLGKLEKRRADRDRSSIVDRPF